jgi:hypothetical protein
MHWIGWIIVVIALQQAGWMAFDGVRALTVGDYLTPRTGEYAGQLGPWSKLVSAVGIEPRSTLMKSIFVVYGGAWLIVIACFLLRMQWSWWAMLGLASGALWYLPFGTLLSIAQIVLLLLPQMRASLAS